MTLRSDVGRRRLWHTGGVLAVGTVVMGAEDVRRAAAFWTRALGYVPPVVLADTEGNRFCVIDTGRG